MDSRDNIVHNGSDAEYDDSYAIDDWEEEEEEEGENDTEDVLVKRLAHLLRGTDLQQEIRDELRRDLEQ